MVISYDTIHQSNIGVRISAALTNLQSINVFF